MFTGENENQEVDIEEYLTPGSVWHRIKKKKVYASTVVCVTNEHVSESHSEEYPKMVIYLDSKDRFCSLPVEDFIAKRTFYNVNPSIESSIETLTSQEGVEDDEEEIIASAEEEAANEETKEEDSSEYDPKKIFKFFTSSPDSKNDDFLIEVQNNIETYTQRPDYLNDVINHEIYLRSGFDEKRLARLLISEESNEVPEIDSFAIEGTVYRISAMLGIFPMYAADGKYHILYLASSMKLDSSENDATEDSGESQDLIVEDLQSGLQEVISSNNSTEDSIPKENNPPSDLVSQLQATIVKK